ncbi:signal peptide protein [Clostridium tyrobutyricum]|uniref:Conserved protein n=2 Tax=Clostridium tyrobutyricum TaxID=1519 RepID=W6N618_CLOTY|nr:hypothetical protein [Clostridium tyrobutyricum]CDL92078.1 Conserved protein [Clostridium tyrobutyricum DIVETGP]ANP68412.1 signal peptide protein [Clostridium tyrobutyricum]MBV4430981.1 signal peptide protein [Clostridium tyrobutyricum]MBV4435602.1 signal peptide protein [Clostridium tyrobutyricum]MBV4439837.1 signal peptide protein [Clostridium tyrobutyricum]
MDNYNWNNVFLGTPKSFKNRVSATLSSLPDQKEGDKMENKKIYKNGSFKKRFIIALVATMMIGTTVLAAGKISSITSTSHNSEMPTYTTIPTAEQLKKDFKFNPKLVNKFYNGYTFTNGCIVNNEGTDDKGNSVAKTKSLNFTYTKGNDKLDLYMENEILGERSKKETVIGNYNSIDLYYHSYANKFVPADYKMTEQDKKDKLSGKYVFSYGSDKEKISQVKYLNWMQDGIYYSFLSIDSDISQEELVKMAEQIIDTK